MRKALALLEGEGELLALARLQHAIDTLVCEAGITPASDAVQQALEQALAEAMMGPERRR